MVVCCVQVLSVCGGVLCAGAVSVWWCAVCRCCQCVVVCCVQVVSPGRSLELTTQLGMARMKAELEAKAAADPPKTDREEAQGRLRSAK